MGDTESESERKSYVKVKVRAKDLYAEVTVNNETVKIINSLPHNLNLYTEETDERNGKKIVYIIPPTTPTPLRLPEQRIIKREKGFYESLLVGYNVEDFIVDLLRQFGELMKREEVYLVVSPITYFVLHLFFYLVFSTGRGKVINELKKWKGKVVMGDSSLYAVRDRRQVVIGTKGFVGGTPYEISKFPPITISQPSIDLLENTKDLFSEGTNNTGGNPFWR